MATLVEDLFRRASNLDENDRATLAGLLLDSLEPEVDEDIESSWLGEIERRVQELDSGDVGLVLWEDVKEMMKKISGGQNSD
jgi:putative addiction module component (TIGR02574 family)